MSTKPLAVIAALSLSAFAVACGEDGNSASSDSGMPTTQQESTQTTDTPAANGKPTETGAAELRAGLTGLLQEHVYLAGIAISQGVGEGLDSGAFRASAATLDENSKALGEAIGSVYGDDAGQQFLALWRDHIGFFVDYTKAKASGDTAGAKKARKGLDDYRAEFGAFLASANPNLTQEAVAEELTPHVESVITTIDSLIRKDGKLFENLRAAAGHMPDTANVLAGAIVKQMPDKFGA